MRLTSSRIAVNISTLSTSRTLTRLAWMAGVLVTVAACTVAVPSAVVDKPEGVPTFVRLASETGEPLGGGSTYEYSEQGALVTARAAGAQLAIRIVGDRVWDGFLALPSSEPRLRAGTFAALTNTPSAGSAGFRWSSQETACGASLATDTIDSVTYDGDALAAIDFHFEQRCDAQTAALRGTVHWRAEDEPRASGPVSPAPAGLWRAPAGSTPAKGSYVYLAGAAGVIPGITLPRTIVPVAGTMQTQAAGNWLTIVAVDSATKLTMAGAFRETIGLTTIQEGYYRDLRGANPPSSVGGLDVSVNNQSCALPVGWFVIDRQFYFQGNLTIVDLRFEIRCGGFGAPLRGQIHWAESGV
jgi:hypothetical protein